LNVQLGSSRNDGAAGCDLQISPGTEEGSSIRSKSHKSQKTGHARQREDHAVAILVS
jgi:hypothetical protein